MDLDSDALAEAREARPTHITFIESAVEELTEAPLKGADYVVLSMMLDEVYDVQSVLSQVRDWCDRPTRLIFVTYNRLWRPALALAERLRLKVAAEGENYIPWKEMENLIELTGMEVTKRVDGILMPVNIPLFSRVLNRWIAPLPLVRSLCMVRVTVAKVKARRPIVVESVSVVVAARNESGHIHSLLERIPKMAKHQEVIFVEGGSTDDTWETIQDGIRLSSQQGAGTYQALQQEGLGKGDAVRTGFSAASGEVLMILDADLSVPPEELPKFLEALIDDQCEFANGTRLVYPMEKNAMRFLNMVGNRIFGAAFTFLLGQPVRDTLCGTKVLWRVDYLRIAANRGRIDDVDPFGDFDLLFGASALGLRIRDIPVHYKERTYGSTNISRFRHGALLLRMSVVAARKLKFVG